jgi:CRISPR-associated protein Cas1
MDYWHAAASRIAIARKFIEDKFDKYEVVLDHLKQRYPDIAYDFIREIMGAEGDVAWKYWNEFSKAIPEKYLLFFLGVIWMSN